MDKEQQLEMLYEKMRAFQMMTVDAREFYSDEIKALKEKIDQLQKEVDAETE